MFQSRRVKVLTTTLSIVTVIASGTALAQPRTGKIFGGVTAQGWPVVFELEANGRSVKRATIGLVLRCTSSSSVADHDAYRRFPLTRTGRYAQRFGPPPVGTPTPQGPTVAFSGSLTGRVTGSRITGVWRYQRVDTDAVGNVTDSCDSGN